MKTAPNSTPTTPSTPGRSAEITAEAIELLCGLIRKLGFSDRAAAQHAGLDTDTLAEWKRQCPDLRRLLLKARAQFQSNHVQNIIDASKGDGGGAWRASAWLLIHVFPEDFSPKADERQKFQDLAALHDADDAEISPVTPSHYSRNTPSAAAPSSGEPEVVLSLSPVTPSHNSRNSPASPAPLGGRILPPQVAQTVCAS